MANPAPPYRIDGRAFKSVAGLHAYLCRKHPGATSVLVSDGRMMVCCRTDVPGALEIIARYSRDLSKPDGIALELIEP